MLRVLNHPPARAHRAARWALRAALFMLVAASVPARGGWERITPSCAGSTAPVVQSSIVFNGRLLIATTTGIYASSDGGLHWDHSDDGIPLQPFDRYPNVYMLAATDFDLLAATYSGLMRSSDGGQHWAPLIVVDSSWGYPDTLASSTSVSVCNGMIFVVGGPAYSSNRPVMRSCDKGATWSRLLNAPQRPDNLSSRFETWGTSLLTHVDQNLLLSRDSGATWTSIGHPRQAFYTLGIGAYARTGDTLWAGTQFFDNYFRIGVWYSVDTGATWTCVDSVYGDTQSIGFLGATPHAIVSASEHGGQYFYPGSNVRSLRLSWDGGHTWRSSVLNETITAAFEYDGILLLGTTNGLYATRDSGSTWTAFDAGARQVATQSLLATSGNLLVGSYRALFRSTDDGMHWSSSQPVISDMYGMIDTRAGLYVGTCDSGIAGRSIYLSEDAGRSWRAAGNGATNGYFEEILNSCTRRDSVWMAGSFRVYRAEAGVNRWSASDDVKDSNGISQYVNSIAAGKSCVIVGTLVGPFISTDGARTCTLINDVGPVFCRVSSSEGTLYVMRQNDSQSAIIYRSTDDGSHWQTIGNGLGTTTSLDVVGSGGALFALTDSAVHVSTDAGDTWRLASDGLPLCVNPGPVSAHNGYLFLALGGELWRRPLAELGLSSIETNQHQQEVPPTPTLTIAPNPSTGVTMAAYTLDVAATVDMTITDILGNIVMRAPQHRGEAGNNTVEFNTRGYTPGIYIVRITTTSGHAARILEVVR